MIRKIIVIFGIVVFVAVGSAIYLLRSSWVYPRDQIIQVDLTAIATQLEFFRAEQGHYPSDQEGGLNALIKAYARAGPNDARAPYMVEIPHDPWNHPYQYHWPGRRNPQKFDLYSWGADGIESGDDIYFVPSERP